MEDGRLFIFSLHPPLKHKRSTKDPEKIVLGLKGKEAEGALCLWINLFTTDQEKHFVSSRVLCLCQ